jgi:hypothetical protein
MIIEVSSSACEILLTFACSKVLYTSLPFGTRKNSDHSALLSFLPPHLLQELLEDASGTVSAS